MQVLLEVVPQNVLKATQQQVVQSLGLSVTLALEQLLNEELLLVVTQELGRHKLLEVARMELNVHQHLTDGLFGLEETRVLALVLQLVGVLDHIKRERSLTEARL